LKFQHWWFCITYVVIKNKPVNCE